MSHCDWRLFICMYNSNVRIGNLGYKYGIGAYVKCENRNSISVGICINRWVGISCIWFNQNVWYMFGFNIIIFHNISQKDKKKNVMQKYFSVRNVILTLYFSGDESLSMIYNWIICPY